MLWCRTFLIFDLIIFNAVLDILATSHGGYGIVAWKKISITFFFFFKLFDSLSHNPVFLDLVGKHAGVPMSECPFVCWSSFSFVITAFSMDDVSPKCTNNVLLMIRFLQSEVPMMKSVISEF